MSKPKEVVRCENKSVHRNRSGNILMVYDSDSIYIKCNDRGCKRWTRIKLDVPGIDLDLTKAAVTQTVLPKDQRFNLCKAVTVISEGGNS